MKKILLICAMEKEAKQIVEALEMKELRLNLFENKTKNMQLLITGIGKELTAISLTRYLSENGNPDLIVNVGYAGSTDIPIGKWVNISRVYNDEWELPGEEKYIMLAGGSQKLELLDDSNIESVECYSSESFVTETDINDHVAFDMELHSISLICDLYKIKLLSLKKISDNLSVGDYYSNLKKDDVFELSSCLDILKL